MLATTQSLLQAKNSHVARGFLVCFGSELAPAQRRKLEQMKPSAPSSDARDARDANSPALLSPNPTRPLSEAISACYQRVLRSNAPADRAELRSLIAGLRSLDEIESVLRDCVKKESVLSQLEAKQFVLALLDASRVDEAESIARLLRTEFNVGSCVGF